MSKEELLLEVVLDGFSSIQDVLNSTETKDIENALKQLKLDKKQDLIELSETKKHVDAVFELASKVKKDFYKHYKELQTNIKKKLEEESETNSISKKDLKTKGGAKKNETPAEVSERVDETTKNPEEEAMKDLSEADEAPLKDSDVIDKEKPEKSTSKKADVVKDTEKPEKVNEINGNDLSDPLEVESDPLEKGTSKEADIAEGTDKINEINGNDLSDPLNVESVPLDTLETEKVAEADSVTIKTEDTTPKFLKLVDINKLVDSKFKSFGITSPNVSKKMDSSIIVLTSSDEENTPQKSPPLNSKSKNDSSKNNSEKVNPVASRKLRSGGPSTKNKAWSSSESKKKLDYETNNGDKKRINPLAKQKENDKEEKSSKSSKEDDTEKLDSVPNSPAEETTISTSKNKMNGLQTSDSEGHNSGNKSDNDSWTKNSNKKRKSTAKPKCRKEKEKSSKVINPVNKQVKKDSLSTDSDQNPTSSSKTSKKEDESNIENKSNSLKIKKKDNLNESSLSDTSSIASNEIVDETLNSNEKKLTKKRSRKSHKKNDSKIDKFNLNVQIPIPRYNCEEMQKLYLRKKNLLEVKRLTKMDSLKRVRTSKKDNVSSSSETEKPANKKLKMKFNLKEIAAYDKLTSSEDGGTDEEAGDSANSADGQAVDETMEVDLAKHLLSGIKDVSDNEANLEVDEDASSQNDNEKPKSTEGQKKKKDKKSSQVDEKEGSDHASADSDKSVSEGDDLKKKKSNWRNDKLLTEKLTSSDSDEKFDKFSKRKDKSRDELVRKAKQRIKKKSTVISDSDSDPDKKADKSSGDEVDPKSDESSNSEKESDQDEAEEEDVVKKKTSRKRIKRTKDSSSDDEDDKSTRKQIRKVLDKDSLSETTKKAEAEEKERKARLIEKQKKYNQLFDFQATNATVEKLVLDFDEKTKEELLKVHKGIVKKLKPHQANGVQFMWDACFESLKRAKSTKGSGCILAHCMGLGKTLQVIALTHTLLMNSEQTGVERVMVVCPLNTVLNWKQEYKQWMPDEDDFEVYELVSCKQNFERQYAVEDWYKNGGVLIIGYNMFRTLSNPSNKRLTKKLRKTFQEGLVDPGPDLVICDEGHLLKNEKTHLSIAMNRIKSIRRIVLTGTPLQNNLKEYWCMVQFIKPNLLGTYKEYLNRFVNPITNGQYTDSTLHDIQIMRKRSHVLHKLLDGVVQRRDYAVLQPYLPPKHEYVLFVNLTETQIKLYEYYMEHYARRNDGSNRTSFLFTDFQAFQRICTHPRVLFDKSIEVRNKKEKDGDDDETDSEGSLKDFIDDGNDSSSSAAKTPAGTSDDDSSDKESAKKTRKTRLTRATLAKRKENNESGSDLEELANVAPIKGEWWQEFCDGPELDNLNNSGKLFLLFQILKECEQIGDKILIFSQSLYTLNCIEYFLNRIDEATQAGNTEVVGGHSGSWSIGLDYFRLDGSSSCDNRSTWCNMFNNPKNTRARLFLISTKAGGLGINLVAANRVIIFDVSWNPSHDIQSIYRVYRFGQTKPSYVYRFVSYGTMEMKVYERQVTKQAISKRVIDEQQIDRHYNQNDLAELYKCDLKPTDRPIPLVPKDVLLGELLQNYEKFIYKYHEHQSLLENKEDEGLNEAERKAAWEEFENEKVIRNTTGSMNNFNLSQQAIATALTSLVRKDNPTWSEVQVKGIIPALAQQLQLQISEGDFSMYTRVQQEIRLLQAAHAQKMKEQFYQQQIARMIQLQQQQAQMVGDLNVNPRSLLNVFSRGGPSAAPKPTSSVDIIELND